MPITSRLHRGQACPLLTELPPPVLPPPAPMTLPPTGVAGMTGTGRTDIPIAVSDRRAASGTAIPDGTGQRMFSPG
jgi:hypothetical protein